MDGRYYKLSNRDYTLMLKLRRVIDLLLAESRHMPVMHARAFVEVAMVPLKGPTTYGRALGVSQPYMSRCLQEIGSDPRYRTEPSYLVNWAISPESLREKEYFLSAKGLNLLENMLSALR